MKRFLLCLILSAAAVCAMGQVRYKLYGVKGNVLYKGRTSSQWEKAQVRTPLTLHDVFDIPPYGTVSVMDMETGMVFTSENHGKINVRQVIEVAEEKSENIASSVKKYIVESLTERQLEQMHYGMAGVTERTFESIESEDKAVSDILHIASDALNGKVTSSRMPVTLERVRNAADGTFHFTVRNGMSEPFYINLLAVSTDNVRICFNPIDEHSFNCIMPPGKQLDLHQYVFADEGNDTRFILLISTEDFNVAKIRSRLRNNAAPKLDKHSGVVSAISE